jgi:hypothetical protein
MTGPHTTLSGQLAGADSFEQGQFALLAAAGLGLATSRRPDGGAQGEHRASKGETQYKGRR